MEDKLNAIIRKHSLDALLISDDKDMRYFSGFTSKDGLLLSLGDQLILITDGRYMTAVAELKQADKYITQTGESYLDAAIKLLKGTKISRLGFQDAALTAGQYLQLDNQCSAELVSIGDDMLKLRAVKSAAEIEKIKKAQRITDKAFAALLPYIYAGMTEKQVAFKLYCILMECGADGLAFDTIAAAGTHGALPHAVPSDKVLEQGELLTLDFGAVLDGYHSDMTRTVAIGQPEQKLIDIYNLVLSAQLQGIAALRSGMTGREADKVARDVFEAAGYGQYFVHSLGHGVGLEIHEQPNLSMRSETVLLPNMIVTVEPGLYIPDLCGVRIEDMCLITDNGYKNLTGADKRLIIL